ncbi:MAG: hypothetical protein FIB08_04210 [Candidatus Methanoperedens sp.]|nr:hypothetical protein [Candidatus Methanoperedens sp.]
MSGKAFLKNDTARVPFAVIGVFLIIVSLIVSMNLTRLDIKMAKTMSTGIEVTAPDTALQYAKADLARAVNYAGMDALKTLGETPVIKPDNTSEYYRGTYGDPYLFSLNRAKAMTNNTLNYYIQSNYEYDTFTYRGFSVNADPPGSWEKITIRPVKMKLNRTITPPVLAPGGGRFEKGYQTYWVISAPLNLHLKDLETGSELVNETITVETVITTRYPLLKDLTDEYGERVNGTNAVMTETTAFATAYTWAGGYLQYSKGTPKNIVNNSHLALILNGALLLDQGFVFNSADPASIVEYARETAYTLTNKKRKYEEVALDNGSLKIDPQKDAFNSTGNSSEAEETFNRAKSHDYNATPITDYLNNESRPGGSIVYQEIMNIIPQVYSTRLATGVARQITETPGEHEGYESDAGAEDWGEPDTMRPIGTIPRDTYVPGNLEGEIWEVTWTRQHLWRHYYIVYYSCEKTRSYDCTDSEGNPSTCTETYIDTCSRTEFNEMATTDKRVDIVSITLKALENSKVEIPLEFKKSYLSSKNDIEKPYGPAEVTYFSSRTDPNLEEAFLKYRDGFYVPNKNANIKNMGLNGDTDIQYYSGNAPVPFMVEVPDWVYLESRLAVNNITNSISRDVHLDPEINYTRYPVPSDFLNATRDNLIMKIERNETGYINKPEYFYGKYKSASAKVISATREWYVDEVKHQIWDKFSNGSGLINEKIRGNFSVEVTDANRNASKLLSEGMVLPFGVPMRAFHVDENGKVYAPEELEAWNESVTLAINQEPDYLDPNVQYGDEKLYILKLRNTNLMTEFGLPILPTFDPWIMTVNAWEINVEGEFVKFEVQDVDNEVHPNPIFGHDAQVYVRKFEIIKDPVSESYIGNNLPINFNFTTGTFIAVPPGKTGVGDREGGILTTLGYVEKSKGWNKG